MGKVYRLTNTTLYVQQNQLFIGSKTYWCNKIYITYELEKKKISNLKKKKISMVTLCGFAPQGDGRALKMVIEPTIS